MFWAFVIWCAKTSLKNYLALESIKVATKNTQHFKIP